MAKDRVVEKVSSAGVRIVEVDVESHGQRLDNYLIRFLKGVPKSRIYRIVRKGEVRVNKGRAKPDTRLASGDQVRIPPVRVAEPGTVSTGLAKPLAVIFEDRELLVVNKPAGLAVHGGSGIQHGLIEQLRAERPNEYFELVHRLDRETSGLLLLARKRSALRDMQQWFQQGDNRLVKRYLAVVFGRWPRDLQDIRAPISKNQMRGGERYSQVSQAGKPAETRFRLLNQLPVNDLDLAGSSSTGEEGADCLSLIEATLLTGRTHQIRVHCQFSGHPIAGDTKYADNQNDKLQRQLSAKGLGRLMLHAREIRFPDGRQFVAPVDGELKKFVELFSKNK